MSIWGVGIDLCEIQRIEKSLERHGIAFARKILHENELALFEKHQFPARYLAKRFAAKEAFAKAIGTGIAGGVTLPEIEIFSHSNGRPAIKAHGKTDAKLAELQVTALHLSISDESNLAIAQVTIEVQQPE